MRPAAVGIDASWPRCSSPAVPRGAGTPAADPIPGRARGVGASSCNARRRFAHGRHARVLAAGVLAATQLFGGCASQAPTPEWQLHASSGLEHVREAYLADDPRGDAATFALVRADIARTGRPALLARAELVRCALRIASLVVAPCPGFEALRVDADPAEKAYADYLLGRANPEQAPLLPQPHRPLLRAGSDAASDLAALDRMTNPLSRLVGASVLLQTGRGTPAVIRRAVDTASTQGWSRPLRAWLQVQLRQAQAAGDTAEAERIARRIALASAAAAPASAPTHGGTPPRAAAPR